MESRPPVSAQAAKHLYVHIPFCRSRCAYCDFASQSVGGGEVNLMRHYLDRLRQEIDEWRDFLDLPLETIFVGGGTPTMLPRNELLGMARELLALLAEGGEFTVEANPGTVDSALLRDLSRAGVTRLSLGVQSFSSRLREVLGRDVSDGELAGALSAIHEAEWREWNLDLIHGIPGQTEDEMWADLDAAIEAGPTHISLYDLTYTPVYRTWVNDRLGSGALERAEKLAELSYAGACTRLVEAGYERYEVSNFALPGHECRHNMAYWSGADYVGVGASAVSTVSSERLTNPQTVEEYLAGVAPGVEIVSAFTRMWERAMTGLRTSCGIDECELSTVLDFEAVERLLRAGCLERRCGKLRLNAGFLDVSNSIISAVLATSPESS